MNEVLMAGLSTPESIDELVWYGFCCLVTWFLYSIRQALLELRKDLKEEVNKREDIESRLARQEAKCEAYHQSN